MLHDKGSSRAWRRRSPGGTAVLGAALAGAAMLAAAVSLSGGCRPDSPSKTRLDECGTPGAGWVFCTGFEEGNLALWDDYDGNPPETNTLMDDPGPFNVAGNHVMRLNAPPGRSIADLVKFFPDGYDVLYARWYQKWETGYDFSVPNHGSGLLAGDREEMGISGIRPNGDDRFASVLEPNLENHRLQAYTYSRGMYQDCIDPASACWGDLFPCMVDSGQTYCTKPQHRPGALAPILENERWYCLEIMMNAGTATTDSTLADGVLDFWVDGQEIGPWTGLWLRTSPDLKLDILWMTLFFHADHPEAGIRLDNIVVSTERIGPVTSMPVAQVGWAPEKAEY